MSPSRPVPPSAELHPFDRLVALMSVLRSADGCAWDRAQDLQTLKAFLVEESYEVLDAIDGEDVSEHLEELGDLLLQVVFQAQIRDEEGSFDVQDVCRGITEKMIRRHPHVFGDTEASTAAEAHASWEARKAEERAVQERSVLDGVPSSLPALLRATRLGQKASSQGFDWQQVGEVVPAVREEVEEFVEAASGSDFTALEHEFGDLLFSLANLARHLEIDAEEALRGASRRFTRRFQHIETTLRQRGLRMNEVPAERLEELWQGAKDALLDSE